MGRLTEAEFSDAVQWLERRDAALGAWMRRIERPQLTRRHSHFASLARAIVAQQLSNKAAATINARVFGHCRNPRGPKPGELSTFDDDTLRSLGLSRQKVRYLRALDEAFVSGHLRSYRFSGKSDEEIIADLTIVPGIGRWTAEMFLIFSLHRPDIFSEGDLALRNGIMRLDGVEGLSPQQCAERAERFAPYRTVASLYLWRIAHFDEEAAKTF